MLTAQKAQGAILYTRVSTAGQVEDGTSLASQLTTCRKKAADLGLSVAAEYEDAGISGGFLTLRPGMMQAIADIESGKADTLVIANMTRYSRDVEHQQVIKKAVRRAGGQIVFTDMHYDDTPQGNLAFNVSGAFAAFERELIRERMMNGHKGRAKEGIQPQRSRAPFGYHIPTKADVMRGDYPVELLGRYVIVEERARIVRRIFDDLATGRKSLSSIAYELQQEGIPTPQGGVFWGAATLRCIVTNPVYKGEPVLGRTMRVTDEGRLAKVSVRTGRSYRKPTYEVTAGDKNQISLTAPAIVSTETWDLAQTTRRVNQSLQGGNPMNVRMLSGRVVCPHCGGGMSLRGKSYVCSRSKRAYTATREYPCGDNRYQAAIVEEAVISAIVMACERPEALAEAFRVYLATEQAAPDTTSRVQLATVDKDLAELDQEEAALIRAQVAGIRSGASPDAYATMFADIASKRKQMRERRAVLSRSTSANVNPSSKSARRLNVDDLKLQILSDVRLALSETQTSGAERRSIISEVIDRVACQPEGADIQFRPGILGGDTFKPSELG